MEPTREEGQVLRISSWEQFHEVTGRYRSWAFRGQIRESWPLLSSLSRYLIPFGVRREAWPEQETRVLRIFQRKAHLLLRRLPAEGDALEWLALMQHYGAPTRLLDFSWSPFVAAFFALERATEDAALWALFPPGLNARPLEIEGFDRPLTGQEFGPWVRGSYERLFVPNRLQTAVIGEPHRMNRRLVAQGGTFVMPGVLHEPVERLVPPDSVVKFVLDTTAIRRRALDELYNMNISYATLFPGLGGLARSLAYELEHHWAYDPITMEHHRGFR